MSGLRFSEEWLAKRTAKMPINTPVTTLPVDVGTQAMLLIQQPTPSKMHNTATEVDGKRFDSTKEARRYGELKLLERAGEIFELQCQVKFELPVNGVVICSYVADFVYRRLRDGVRVVEDTKPTDKDGKVPAGYRGTHVYRMFKIKKKLMKAIHSIDVEEV